MYSQVGSAWDPHTKLEFLKMCIRSVAEKAQAERKRYEKCEEDFINEEIEIVVEALTNPNLVNGSMNGLIEHLEDLRVRKSLIVEASGEAGY